MSKRSIEKIEYMQRKMTGGESVAPSYLTTLMNSNKQERQSNLAPATISHEDRTVSEDKQSSLEFEHVEIKSQSAPVESFLTKAMREAEEKNKEAEIKK